jgi:hypothetical protein
MEIRRTKGVFDLAAELLREEFADQQASRHNVLLKHGSGREALAERRKWAEAWQLLEQGRLICRDPDEGAGSTYFLTAPGKQALAGGDIEGALLLAGVK